MGTFSKREQAEHRFPLGKCVATPGALGALHRNKQLAADFLSRHRAGDWGTLSDADKKANDEAARGEGRILSSYLLDSGEVIWVCTEADRSVTTVLTPQEY